MSPWQGSTADLDVSKGHPDAGELNADVVRPAVLYERDGVAPCGCKLPQGGVLQNLQIPHGPW